MYPPKSSSLQAPIKALEAVLFINGPTKAQSAKRVSSDRLFADHVQSLCGEISLDI